MVKPRNQKFKELIYRFAREIEKDIPVDKILLFGSYACNRARPDSDIDIIVVSPAFKKGRHIEHMQYLFRKAAKISSFLEPVPISPEDLKEADSRIFPGQVLKTAKVYIFGRNGG